MSLMTVYNGLETDRLVLGTGVFSFEKPISMGFASELPGPMEISSPAFLQS